SRILARGDGLDHFVLAGVNDRKRVAAGIVNHDPSPIRRERQGAWTETNLDFREWDRCLPAYQRNHGHGPFVGDVADRIYPHQGPLASRARDAPVISPASAPVAHVNLVPRKYHIIGRDADIPQPVHLTSNGVQLRETTG